MTRTVTVEDAQANLRKLIDMLAAEEELVITDNHRPVAKLIAQGVVARRPRIPGNCRGMITLLVEDEEHLKDFAEYMP